MARVKSKAGSGPGILVRTAMRYGMSRGLLGGSRGWLWVGGAAWTYNKLAHRTRSSSDLVFSETVGVGQPVEIRVIPPPPTRRDRRRAGKADRLEVAREREAAARAAELLAQEAQRDAKRARKQAARDAHLAQRAARRARRH